MKTILKTLLICAAALAPTLSSYGQGSVTPSGTPGPTMKTLDQVKAGTPIGSPNYTITLPGNYFLTGNLTVSSGDGIDVNASGVTIDLNGFTISGVGGGTGINIESSYYDITILNGHIGGGVTFFGTTFFGGLTNGINYAGTGNIRVTGVTVSWVSSNGIYLGSGNNCTVVDSCLVNTAQGTGIQASGVSHSTANQCGGTAINANNTASDCYGYSNGSGDGVDANNASNCYGVSNNGTGLSAGNNASNCIGYALSSNGGGYGIYAGSSALECSGSSPANDGIHVASGAASNCQGSSGGAGKSGLYALTAQNCIGSNTAGGYGIYIQQIAIGCYGSSSTGTGLYAPIANSCAGSGSPPYSVANKYNMP